MTDAFSVSLGVGWGTSVAGMFKMATFCHGWPLAESSANSKASVLLYVGLLSPHGLSISLKHDAWVLRRSIPGDRK